jgi:hypothetical protein
MTQPVTTPLIRPVWRDLEPSLKETTPRLCRSPAAILDPGLQPARTKIAAGTEERLFSPNKGTMVCSDLSSVGGRYIGLAGPGAC